MLARVSASSHTAVTAETCLYIKTTVGCGCRPTNGRRRAQNGCMIRDEQYGYQARQPGPPSTQQWHVDVEDMLGLDKHRLAIRNRRSTLTDRCSSESPKDCRIRQEVMQLERARSPLTRSRFRWALRTSCDVQMFKQRKNLIRVQLSDCRSPRDVLFLTAMFLQRPDLAQELAMQHEYITKAMYRCRMVASDREVSCLLTGIIACLERDHISIPIEIYNLLAVFAARSRDLDLMLRALRRLKRKVGRGQNVGGTVFHQILAKISFGHRNFGAIRNGDWQREELLQVITGFEREQNLPADEKCHLETFLRRDDWQFWHPWLGVLGTCQASELLWKEWVLWRDHYAIHMPRGLLSLQRQRSTKQSVERWFVDQMAISGDLQRAWEILCHVESDFTRLIPRTKLMLLTKVEYAGPRLARTRQACIQEFGIDICDDEEGRPKSQHIGDSDQTSSKQVSKVIAILLTQVGPIGRLRRFVPDVSLPPSRIDGNSSRNEERDTEQLFDVPLEYEGLPEPLKDDEQGLRGTCGR